MNFRDLRIATRLWLALGVLIGALVLLIAFAAVRGEQSEIHVRLLVGNGSIVEQRMPDEARRHAGSIVLRFFERQDERHVRDVASQPPQPSGPPCPHLRPDEVKDRHVRAPRRRCQA